MNKFVFGVSLVFLSSIGLGAQAASYQLTSGNSYCREYNNNVVVGGRVQSSYGTACMQPDGSWAIQSVEEQGMMVPPAPMATPVGFEGYYAAPGAVYAAPQPYYYPQPYYQPPRYIQTSPSLVLGFNFGDDHDRDRRGRGWDRGGHRWHGHGHGRGHGHDHHHHHHGRH